MKPVDVKLFFNFLSPYCYLASKTLFKIFDDYNTKLVWHPRGGWSGRSNPERAKLKVPLTRQDVARIARKMGIPLTPPPLTTEPTKAGAGSLLAERKGLLRPYLVAWENNQWPSDRGHGKRGGHYSGSIVFYRTEKSAPVSHLPCSNQRDIAAGT
mgnify:CR=1 FL=1